MTDHPDPLAVIIRALTAERYTPLPAHPTGACDDGPTAGWQRLEAIRELWRTAAETEHEVA